MLIQWKIHRYRQTLAKELARRNESSVLQSAFDRHWVDHMIAVAIRSNQSPASLAAQLSRLADQKRQERDATLHRRMEQLSARARA